MKITHAAARLVERIDVARRRRIGLWYLRRRTKFAVCVLRLDRYDLLAELCSEAGTDEARAWGDRELSRSASGEAGADEALSGSPSRRIEPRPRENGWPCVVCSRAVFFADGMVPCVCDGGEEIGGLCAHCLGHFHEGDPALGNLLRGNAARLRERADLLDALDAHRPEIVLPGAEARSVAVESGDEDDLF